MKPSEPPKTVIVAIDNTNVSGRFSTTLQEAGHRTIDVRTREELLHRLRMPSVVADLVVLDLRLGEQGIELVSALRMLDSKIPIVVFSGSVGSTADVRELAKLGVDSYMNEHCTARDIVPSLAPRLFPDNFNRRTGTRILLDLPIAYRFADSIATAPTLNLSRSGLAVRTMTPVEVGTKVHVRFRLPCSESDIEIDCRVAWSNRRIGMGLQFEKIRNLDQLALDEFVDQHIFDDRAPE